MVVTSFQVGPQVKRRPSSTYIPRDEDTQFCILWSRADVYTMERTGESGEP